MIVNNVEFHPAAKVYRESPVDIVVRFDAIVGNWDVPQCCAFVVEVYDEDATSSDDLIATHLAYSEVPCFCLKPGTTYRCVALSAGSTVVPPPQNEEPNQIVLPRLRGKWPVSDGLFSDELEVYCVISVYVCGVCQEETTGKTCGAVGASDLLERAPVFRYSGKDEDKARPVVIVDGQGVKEGLDAIRGAVKLAPNVFGSGGSQPKAPDSSGMLLGNLLRDQARMKRMIGRLKRRIRYVEGRHSKG